MATAHKVRRLNANVLFRFRTFTTPRLARLSGSSSTLIAFFMISGAMPVVAIPLHVSGALAISDAGLVLVLPLATVALLIMLRRSHESRLAFRGFCAGLVAVTAYDLLRVPLAMAGIWPDFIPALGGWIQDNGGSNVALGYAWRYIGDGGGIGMAYFAFCGAVHRCWPSIVARRAVELSICYGVFIWSGLIATIVLLPGADSLLFRITPGSFALSLAGHLIYGTVLGFYLRRASDSGALVLQAGSCDH